jgi:hypothetical protein
MHGALTDHALFIVLLSKEKHMLTNKTQINQFIDTFQGAKSTFLKTVVTEEKVRAPLQTFVDAQTEFAKEMVRITDQFFTKNMTSVKM